MPTRQWYGVKYPRGLWIALMMIHKILTFLNSKLFGSSKTKEKNQSWEPQRRLLTKLHLTLGHIVFKKSKMNGSAHLHFQSWKISVKFHIDFYNFRGVDPITFTMQNRIRFYWLRIFKFYSLWGIFLRSTFWKFQWPRPILNFFENTIDFKVYFSIKHELFDSYLTQCAIEVCMGDVKIKLSQNFWIHQKGNMWLIVWFYA